MVGQAIDFVEIGADILLPVEDWLRRLADGRPLSRAVHDVVQSAIGNPEFASYASAMDVAKTANVNVATVTRAAQAVGFSGWPALRQEIRARYLGLLTASEVATIHSAHSTGQPFDDALSRHLEGLNAVRKTLDRRVVRQFAKALASSNRRLIAASGSFAAVGKLLAHNATLAGYRTELIEDGATLANAISDLSGSDMVVAITYWRLYNATIVAARQAKALGATLCVISDTAVSPLAELADHLLIVPAEGASFFPSMAPSVAVVEGICAELVALDPDKAGKSIAAAETQWQAFDLLYLNSKGARSSGKADKA
jgi:DNA-binding MurR/RpiR family transcriptional regulator